MKRLLFLLDDVDDAEAAFREVTKVTSPGDKVVVLAVVGQPSNRIVGSRPQVTPNFYVPPQGLAAPRTGTEMPAYETDEDVQARVSGDVLAKLSGPTAILKEHGLDAFCRVIVRDEPGEAVDSWARDEQPTHVAVMKSAWKRLRQRLRHDGEEATVLEGDIAPVIALPQ
ncbi:MAG TPA: hypothetical protein VNN21_07195 [Dehalococcoidia bacterium]|nr:hypothetical protein [Dehalococcoidia bacterium]